jgi:hypothetical protein
MVSFAAEILARTRSASITTTPDGFCVTLDGPSATYSRCAQALNVAREHLGRFLATAERQRDLGWRLTVTVAAGSATYGTLPAQFGFGGRPVAPDEQLVRIRGRYHDGDGPIAALQNALQIARAYPPESARAAA